MLFLQYLFLQLLIVIYIHALSPLIRSIKLEKYCIEKSVLVFFTYSKYIIQNLQLTNM